MSEIALQVMVLAMLAGGLQYIRTQKLIYFLAAAGAGCIALLLKPVFYPFAAVLAVAGIALGWQRRQIGAVLIGLLPALVVGGYMERNQQRTGYFHFSSIAEINLLHYNAAGVVRELNGQQAEEVWVAGVLHEAQLQPDFGARQRLIQQRASAVLRDHWVVYAKQHVSGMVALFLDPGRFDISEFLDLPPLPGGGLLAQARTSGLWAAVQRLPTGLLSCLALVLLANVLRLLLAARGFWQMRRGPEWVRYGRWLALLLLGYVALLTGPLGAARFLVPVWPVLLGLALVGIKSQPADVSASNAAAAGANA